MKTEELLQNEELLKQCEKEVAKKLNQGLDIKAAKMEVGKAIGVEFDEDAAHAAEVGKMELSDEELEHVAGGANWCWGDHACITVYHHDNKPTDGVNCERDHGNVCAWDYECFTIAKCDLDAMDGM